jgi:UDP-2,3-diacylglucosamine pyrophosphatase LpxH
VKAIDRFEGALASEARRRGFDGVVCGHIHHAEMREIGGVLYVNDGDWVESCTALVEHADGRLELLDWAARNGLSFAAPRRTVVTEPA